MALDGMEFAGGKLRVVTVRELKQHRSASTMGTTGATAFMPSAVKFGAKKKRGGKR